MFNGSSLDLNKEKESRDVWEFGIPKDHISIFGSSIVRDENAVFWSRFQKNLLFTTQLNTQIVC